MFERLKERYLQDRQEQKEKTFFYIENGYFPTWNEKEFSDNGLQRYSTSTRWDQYTNGQIDRTKAVELAQKRYAKQLEKEIQKQLELLDVIAAAPDLQFISVNVYYKRSSVWGYCPSVDVRTNNGFSTGYASGCGYDKESAAVADAFNKDHSILKALYTIKENGLIAGLSDESKTACTGVDNRNICGYGSGYGVIPYFEGGVGVGCFWDILKRGGYTTRCNYGKHENYYTVSKESEV